MPSSLLPLMKNIYAFESLPQSRKGDSGENTTVDTVKRKVSCETEGRYQFCLARKHLQDALNGSDNIMHVGVWFPTSW